MVKSFQMYETQDEWDNVVTETQEVLKRNTGKSDLIAFGAELIYKRILENPHCYAEFGVYWFAIKDLLKRHGYDFGETDDEEMRLAYTGRTDAHTLVAAEKFKEMYRKTYFQNTTHFTLVEDNGREWVLNDPEMAARVK